MTTANIPDGGWLSTEQLADVAWWHDLEEIGCEETFCARVVSRVWQNQNGLFPFCSRHPRIVKVKVTA